MTTEQELFLKDLFHELRMLLGAAKMAKLFNENGMGNPENYFKDSVYLHARNLYNFFRGDARHDASVYDYVVHVFDVDLYIKWKNPLHNHVLHIKNTRTEANNEINGVHINTMIQAFANDIEKLWQNWIDVTIDPKTKKLLRDLLKEAQEQADGDYNISVSRIMDK